MRLVETQIAIRERDAYETLDLSLHLLRNFAGPVFGYLLLGAAPLALLNHLAVRWMLDLDAWEYDPFLSSMFVVRYYWWIVALTILEAPLTTALITTFVGNAVFTERPSRGTVLRRTRIVLHRLLISHGLVRGAFTAIVFIFLLDRLEFSWLVEVAALSALVFVQLVMRLLRPYVNEIILLERNRLMAKDASETLADRSKKIHKDPSGAIYMRSLIGATFGFLLAVALYNSLLFFIGVFTNAWMPGPFMHVIGLPICLWLTAGFLAIARFLDYLDRRIRYEGWEVELRLNAEADRLEREPA